MMFNHRLWLCIALFVLITKPASATVPAIESTVGACLTFEDGSARLDDDGKKSFAEFLKLIGSIPTGGRLSADFHYPVTGPDATYLAATLAADRQEEILRLLGEGAPALKSSFIMLSFGGRGPEAPKCQGGIGINYLASSVVESLCSGKNRCRLQCTKDGCH